MEAATIRNIAKQAEIPLRSTVMGKIDELYDAVALYLWQTRPVPAEEPEDPISGLYHAIEGLVVFGLTHPGLYLHISKPRDANVSGLWGIQVDELKDCIRQVAKAGLFAKNRPLNSYTPFALG